MWPMSSLNDLIGGANLFGGTNFSFVADRFGNPNSAIYFNNGYLQAPSGIYFTENLTMIAWINVQKFVNYSRIIDFGWNGSNDAVFLSFNPDSTLYSGIYNLSVPSTLISASCKIAVNAWYHVAMVFYQTTASIYVIIFFLKNKV